MEEKMTEKNSAHTKRLLKRAERIREELTEFFSTFPPMFASHIDVEVDFEKREVMIRMPLLCTRSHETSPTSRTKRRPSTNPPAIVPHLSPAIIEPPVLDPSKIFTPDDLINSLTAEYCGMYRCRCDFRVIEDIPPSLELAINEVKYPDLYEGPVANLSSMWYRAKELKLQVLGAADIPRFLADPNAIPAWIREKRMLIVFAGTTFYSRNYNRKCVMVLDIENMRVWLIGHDVTLDRRFSILACK